MCESLSVYKALLVVVTFDPFWGQLSITSDLQRYSHYCPHWGYLRANTSKNQAGLRKWESQVGLQIRWTEGGGVIVLCQLSSLLPTGFSTMTDSKTVPGLWRISKTGRVTCRLRFHRRPGEREAVEEGREGREGQEGWEGPGADPPSLSFPFHSHILNCRPVSWEASAGNIYTATKIQTTAVKTWSATAHLKQHNVDFSPQDYSFSMLVTSYCLQLCCSLSVWTRFRLLFHFIALGTTTSVCCRAATNVFFIVH